MNLDVGELPAVKAERREGADGTVLYVDPVALAALELARDAGMTRAADIASLPQAEELPLRLVVAETRIEILESKLAAILNGAKELSGRLRDLRRAHHRG